jgi:hypothetical protein
MDMTSSDDKTRSQAARTGPASPAARAELPRVDPEHFTVRHEHARGGLGRVLAAHDQVLDRPVAIKELLAPGADAEARFVREARLTARLQHPAIVPVYEAGHWPNGEPFYAMKLVAGRSLRAAIAAAPDLDGRMALVPHVTTVAEAVAYAHSHGIIHRDLKPSNVILGDFGETVVIDWGLAKELGTDEPDQAAAAASSAAGLTVVGQVLGTPQYMPPEQALAEPTDERADVYSLGAMLYEVLAGRAPYPDGDSDKVLADVVAGPPRPLRAVEPGTPPDLAGIVGRAMARDWAGRYASARELAEDLRRFTTGKLVSAHHYSPATLLRRWLWRNRVPVALSAGFLTLLFVVGAVSVARIAGARAAAEERRNRVVLLQARAALRRDPAAAIAWLKSYPIAAGDFRDARAIFEEARGRGAIAVVPNVVFGAVANAPGGGLRFLVEGGRILDLDPATGAQAARALAEFPEHPASGSLARSGAALVVGERRRVTIYDLERGRRRAIDLPAGEALANDVCDFTEDERWLAFPTTGGLGVVALPDGALRILAGDGAAATFASHGATLLWNAWPAHAVQAVDLESGRSERWSSGDVTPGYVLGFTRDGRHAFAGTDEGHLVVWSRTGRLERDLALCPSAIGRVAPAGADRVVVRCSEGVIRLLALDDGRDLQLGSVGMSLGWVDAQDGLVFGAGKGEAAVFGAGVATRFGFDDDAFFGWPTADGGYFAVMTPQSHKALVFRVPRSGDRVLEVADATAQPSSDGRHLVLTRPDGVAICDPRGEACRTHTVDTPTWAAVSADARRVAFASATRSGWLDVETGARADVAGGLRSAAWSPAGHELAIGGDDRTVIVVDTDAGTTRTIERGEYGFALSWSPDGRKLAWADDTGAVEIAATAGGARLRLVADQPIGALAFAADGARLYGGGRGKLWIWDTTTGSAETVSPWHRVGGVRVLVRSPDGRALATGGDDGDVRLLDVETRAASVLAGHAARVSVLAFAPDGRSLASADVEGSVRVWDVATGDVRLLRGHTSPVVSLSYAPTGDQLVTASAERVILFDLARLPAPLGDGAAVAAAIERESSVVLGPDDRPVTPGPAQGDSAKPRPPQ